MCILHIVFCTVCKYVLSICKLLFFCTVWSTLVRISLTKALVLWWCDNKSDLIWYISIDAPWSSESRALFPLWEELAEHLTEKDDVVVAKIDITANDINLHLGEKYPSIKLFPAVYSERVSSLLQITVLTRLRFKMYPYWGYSHVIVSLCAKEISCMLY